MTTAQFDELFLIVNTVGEPYKGNKMLRNGENIIVAKTIEDGNVISVGCYNLGITAIRDIKRNKITFMGNESKAIEMLTIAKN